MKFLHWPLGIGITAFGLVLAWHGYVLAGREMRLVEPRDRLRWSKQLAPVPEIEAAILLLLATTPTRSDVLDAALESDLRLTRRNLSPKQRAMHEERLRLTSIELLKRAPALPEPWCILAVSAFNDNRSGFAISNLEACYALGPYSISVIEMRLRLALFLWDELPTSLRNKAMLDISRALSETMTLNWMTETLASVHVSVPQRQALIESLIETLPSEAQSKFQKAVDRIRAKETKPNPPNR